MSDYSKLKTKKIIIQNQVYFFDDQKMRICFLANQYICLNIINSIRIIVYKVVLCLNKEKILF